MSNFFHKMCNDEGMEGLYQLKPGPIKPSDVVNSPPIHVMNIAIGSCYNNELYVGQNNPYLSNPNVVSTLAVEIEMDYEFKRQFPNTCLTEILAVIPTSDDWEEFDVYRTYNAGGKSAFNLTPQNRHKVLQAIQAFKIV